MSRIDRFVPAAAISVAAFFCLLGTVFAAEGNLWQTDFEAAKAKAKAENKFLLLDFTGSDWCTWCTRLKDEVFDKETFRTEAPKQFVLVELDFPHQKKLTPELTKQNEGLAKQYKIQGYPSILLADSDGQLIARTGYRPDGPEKYVKHLAEFVDVYKTIPPMRAKLKEVKDLDRAKLLDQLIEAYVKLGNEIDEIETWSKEIIALDAQNATGLKVKYEFRVLMAEAAILKERHKATEARVAFDKVLALPGLTGQQKQEAGFAQAECFFHEKDFSGLVACLKKALEAAPKSPKAAAIENALQQFQAVLEAQEAVAKIEADLKKAQGLDRARLLDQLIEARGKLAPYIPAQAQPEETEKLSEEIVALDAENKAGLKQKYGFRMILAEAGNLSRTGKTQEAQEALDKALALPGLTGEQIQQAQFLKARSYLSQNEFPAGLACLKKALEAATKSPNASVLKTMIQRLESAMEEQKSKDRP